MACFRYVESEAANTSRLSDEQASPASLTGRKSKKRGSKRRSLDQRLLVRGHRSKTPRRILAAACKALATSEAGDSGEGEECNEDTVEGRELRSWCITVGVGLTIGVKAGSLDGRRHGHWQRRTSHWHWDWIWHKNRRLQIAARLGTVPGNLCASRGELRQCGDHIGDCDAAVGALEPEVAVKVAMAGGSQDVLANGGK